MATTVIENYRVGGQARPPRPSLGSPEEDERAERQRLLFRMLEHKFQDDALDFFEAAYGDENARSLGVPDTALAPLPAQTAQLCRPGLYDKPPTVSAAGPEPEAVVRMLGEEGALARSRYWSYMRQVMYYCVGIGNWCLRLHVAAEAEGARPSLKPAYPWDLSIRCHEFDPLRPVVVRWLRWRERANAAGQVTLSGWYWDVYDISDPSAPVFSIRSPDPKDKADYTTAFVAGWDGWPWVSPEGVAHLPFVFYRTQEGGQFWQETRPALVSGTLRATANWTMVANAALWSQGNHNIVGGVSPEALGAATYTVEGIPIHTLRSTPGVVTFLPVEEDKQLQLATMTTGVDLAKILDYATAYSAQLAIADGIAPPDALRRSANPTSGAAVALSQADKRAFAASVTPSFREADTTAIRYLAWMMEAVTGVPHTATGYSLTYAPIPLTPTEQKEQREHLQWEEEQGQRSPIDVHLALNPGTTRDQAAEAIISAAVDRARLDREVTRRVAELDESTEGAPSGSAGGGGTGDVQREALNGAQIASLTGLVATVAQGGVPVDAARALAALAVPTAPVAALDAIFDPLERFQAPTPTTGREGPPEQEGPERPAEDAEEDTK